MSDIGAMVIDLIASGCAPEVAAEVVARAFAAGAASAAFRGIPVDSAAEKRRAYDRERKRKLRGIPPDSTGTPQNSENALLLKEDKKEENKKEKKEQNRGTRITPDWQPTADDWAMTIETIGSIRTQSELLKFRDYWIALPGAKGLKLDWPATWRNWIRRISESTGASNGNRTSQNRTTGFAGPPPTGDDAIVTGMGRALERRRAARAADDPGRQAFRTDGGDGFAAGDDSEPGSTSGDGGTRGQLALVSWSNR